jgi:hypothetical protein
MAAGAQYGFGSGILYGIRTDISGVAPIRFGVLQDVTIDFAAEVKELFGQQQFPVDVARGKTKITGKAKFALLQTSVYNQLFFGQTSALGQQLFAFNELQTVPAAVSVATSATSAVASTTLTFASVPAGVVAGASVRDTTATAAIPVGTVVVSKTGTTVTISSPVVAPGVGSGDSIQFGPFVTAANAATFTTDLGVYYSATGLPLTLAASGVAPTVGQYTVNVATGVYSFAVADAAASLLLNYNYGSASSGNTITGGNPLMGTTPKFMCVFQQIYEGHTTNLTLYACVSTKLAMPTKIDDYIISEIDFSAFANASGQVFSLAMDN